MLEAIFTDTVIIFSVTYTLISIFGHLSQLLHRYTHCTKRDSILIARAESSTTLERLVRTSVRDSHKINCRLFLILKSNDEESFKISNRLRAEYPQLNVIYTDEVSVAELIDTEIK